jgi:hypothetical protein
MVKIEFGKRVNEIDRELGLRIGELRRQAGTSQTKLDEEMDLNLRQI